MLETLGGFLLAWDLGGGSQMLGTLGGGPTYCGSGWGEVPRCWGVHSGRSRSNTHLGSGEARRGSHSRGGTSGGSPSGGSGGERSRCSPCRARGRARARSRPGGAAAAALPGAAGRGMALVTVRRAAGSAGDPAVSSGRGWDGDTPVAEAEPALGPPGAAGTGNGGGRAVPVRPRAAGRKRGCPGGSRRGYMGCPGGGTRAVPAAPSAVGKAAPVVPRCGLIPVAPGGRLRGAQLLPAHVGVSPAAGYPVVGGWWV